MRVEPHLYPMNFGDLATSDASTYSRVTIEIPVTRPWVYAAFKVLIQILLILPSAVLGLLVKPNHVEGRIGLGITSLLTMVALQFTATSNLPEVDYLVLIDKIYIVSYLVIIAVLAMMVRGSWVLPDKGPDAVARSDRRAVSTLVGCYFAVVRMLVAGAVTAR